MPSSPRGAAGGGEEQDSPSRPLNYNLLSMDELIVLCKKRRIKLDKETMYNKFRIIAVLREDDM